MLWRLFAVCCASVGTAYRVSFAGDYVFKPASATRTVRRRRTSANPVAPASVRRNGTFGTYYFLKPRHAAGSYPVRVYKYRYVSGHWVSYGYVNARAYNYSTYTKCAATLRLPYAGTWRLRTYHADSGHAAAWSTGYDYVAVK